MECVEELLHRASIAESFSQLEVERCYLSVLDYRKDLLQEDNRDMLQKVSWWIQRQGFLYQLNTGGGSKDRDFFIN